jgi:glycine hydroxymethyltransferase
MALEHVQSSDRELFDYIKSELGRQRNGLEMIPSENFPSLAVLEACGSVLNNKYSEGYPAKRYYGGNQFIDKVESLAISRAKSLFKVPHANVQPYSGSPANLAVYLSVCKPGDTIMGLSLPDGGHLTHGWSTSASGMIFNSVQYHLKPDGTTDIEGARKLALENKPKLIWVGATAYPRALPFKEFAAIADEVGAYLAADISHVAGLVAGGAHESPVDYVHIVTTTTHKTLRGPRGAMIMVTDKGLKKDPELASKIDKMIFPGLQGGPHQHQTAGIAIALMEAAKPEFRDYAAQIVKNSKALADQLMKNGIKLVSNGSENHLILIDLTPFGKGKGVFVQTALDEANITTNKNTIPNEPNSAFYPSGIRLGTPAITTRGMKEAEMVQIADLITRVIKEVSANELPDDKDERVAYLKKFREGIKSNKNLEDVRNQVLKICEKFPLYPDLEM